MGGDSLNGERNSRRHHPKGDRTDGGRGPRKNPDQHLNIKLAPCAKPWKREGTFSWAAAATSPFDEDETTTSRIGRSTSAVLEWCERFRAKLSVMKMSARMKTVQLIRLLVERSLVVVLDEAGVGRVKNGLVGVWLEDQGAEWKSD